MPPSVARDLPGRRGRAESPQPPRAHEVRPRASGVVREPEPVRPKDGLKTMYHGLTTTAHPMPTTGDASVGLSRRERRDGLVRRARSPPEFAEQPFAESNALASGLLWVAVKRFHTARRLSYARHVQRPPKMPALFHRLDNRSPTIATGRRSKTRDGLRMIWGCSRPKRFARESRDASRKCKGGHG
jgi:hypothetical protein